MKKFKIGDKVVTKDLAPFQRHIDINTKVWERIIIKGTISKIMVNPDNFENDSWVYYIKEYSDKYYFYDTHIEIDKSYIRDEKLKELGI